MSIWKDHRPEIGERAFISWSYLDVLDTAPELMPDGTIVWKGHHDRWTLRNEGDLITFVVEDGKWVARNAAGQVVDPD